MTDTQNEADPYIVHQHAEYDRQTAQYTAQTANTGSKHKRKTLAQSLV